MLKYIMALSLYPNLALPDAGNETRRLDDHVYGTAANEFVALHPSSCLARGLVDDGAAGEGGGGGGGGGGGHEDDAGGDERGAARTRPDGSRGDARRPLPPPPPARAIVALGCDAVVYVKLLETHRKCERDTRVRFPCGGAPFEICKPVCVA